MKERVGVVSLGCAKNRVDTEVMLGILRQGGYSIVNDPSKAEILIVNTCGFIGPAKEESIETILEMASYKERGNCHILLVTGCLLERYKDELIREFPEVDGFLGVGNYHEILDIIEEINIGKKPIRYGSAELYFENYDRFLTTAPYTAYIKIAEGCNNCCSYCVIPKIRGPYRSKKIENIVKEIENLVQKGVLEFILIAQDTTRYGEDIYGTSMLPQLLERICLIDGVKWVRVLYSYPEKITPELLDIMDKEPKICKYLDIPIQHIDDDILRAMNRLSSSSSVKALLKRIQGLENKFIVRTSLIVGFPGESEEAFSRLAEFIKEYTFDRMGIFMYSQEEGTVAAEMHHQIPEDIKEQRYHKLMSLQKGISYRKNIQRIGEIYEVIIEGVNEQGSLYYGRSYGEAPEIDGRIYVKSSEKLQIGTFVHVRITKAYDYDLLGEKVNESGE